MLNKVTIIDDTLRRNAAMRITAESRALARRMGMPIPRGQIYQIVKDRGATVVEVIKVRKTFEGEHLLQAVRRARRYIRSGKPLDKAPRHIAHALAAFLAADSTSFKEAVRHVA